MGYFGAPLAIEALLAFFLESTFMGLLSSVGIVYQKGKHLLATYCVAFGSNLSTIWILVCKWMDASFQQVQNLILKLYV